jgi:uncharacterized protein YaiL (DUF2058 family)
MIYAICSGLAAAPDSTLAAFCSCRQGPSADLLRDAAAPLIREQLHARKEQTLADNSEQARLRAEAKFKKAQVQAREGEKAWAEHNAATQATRDKTSRLKAARLAKEAADKEAQPIKAAKGRRKKPAPKSDA